MLLSNFFVYSIYENKLQRVNEVIVDYKEKNDRLSMENQKLVLENNNLSAIYQTPENMPFLQTESDENSNYQNLRSSILKSGEENSSTVSIVYYTNFGSNEQIITLSVPYKKYEFYHKRPHPICVSNSKTIDDRAIAEYITSEESIITQIATTVRSKTQSQEELANALLDIVQDKGTGLSLRYYPSTSTEYKYPIETLVEMGGDCDAHAFLFASLMKAAGFKVILLFFEDILEYQYHIAIAVQLEKPPTNSLGSIDDFHLSYNDEEYYFAETTLSNWRIGDLPPNLKNVPYQIISL